MSRGDLDEPPPFLGEGIAVGDQHLVNGLIRGQVVVFPLELATEK